MTFVREIIGPFITEYISDGFLKINLWSNGRVEGYYRYKKEGEWYPKELDNWKEAEAWYRRGKKE